eukprot:1753679-Pyramimonas_sp.AAC.1
MTRSLGTLSPQLSGQTDKRDHRRRSRTCNWSEELKNPSRPPNNRAPQRIDLTWTCTAHDTYRPHARGIHSSHTSSSFPDLPR